MVIPLSQRVRRLLFGGPPLCAVGLAALCGCARTTPGPLSTLADTTQKTSNTDLGKTVPIDACLHTTHIQLACEII